MHFLKAKIKQFQWNEMHFGMSYIKYIYED